MFFCLIIIKVETAHDSIKNDLNMVQTSVDKYELVTSEQLASAHDFMLYQLSGNISIYFFCFI